MFLFGKKRKKQKNKQLSGSLGVSSWTFWTPNSAFGKPGLTKALWRRDQQILGTIELLGSSSFSSQWRSPPQLHVTRPKTPKRNMLRDGGGVSPLTLRVGRPGQVTGGSRGNAWL